MVQQPDLSASEPPPSFGTHGFFRKLLFGRQSGGHSSAPATPAELPRDQEHDLDPNDPTKPGLIRRMSRKVVPGLPRAQTFRRQQSERRHNLAPIEPSPDERRAVSVDRRSREPRAPSISRAFANPRTSAPGLLGSHENETPPEPPPLQPDHETEQEPIEAKLDRMLWTDDDVFPAEDCLMPDSMSMAETTHSMTTSQYDALIHEELEKTWILNLSMHFRDRSKREKFFVTFREQDHLWRRVTISVDYRNAPPNSLEMDLIHTHYQRDKNAKIYEAIRESLRDIQFYETVTNLKLQTTDGRLHVHVVEDGNEIINYPSVSQIKHLRCPRIRERDIVFDSHMSGFVYKVSVNEKPLIKKEIPSPETVDEFLYEINALSRLQYSRNVIQFYGVVVDDRDEAVKGLLISYADRGALIDVIYEHCKDGNNNLPWHTREKWARQIVQGLSDIHEAGFVQGDFTLSNIVIDENDDAKIIDINRRGCPVGWEPPEATPLIECGQRISMYIGVKSDLYQLGMVLWALATQEDEPESQGRPLILGPEDSVPDWYRQMTEICLNDDPRMRQQASVLLQMFPVTATDDACNAPNPSISVTDGYSLQQYLVNGYNNDSHQRLTTAQAASDWSYVSRPHAEANSPLFEPYYHTRGRSPPSPLPSNLDRCESPRGAYDVAAWAANRNIPSSYSDVGMDDTPPDETPIAERPHLFEPTATADFDTTHQESVRFPEERCDFADSSSDASKNPYFTDSTTITDTEKKPEEMATNYIIAPPTEGQTKVSNFSQASGIDLSDSQNEEYVSATTLSDETATGTYESDHKRSTMDRSTTNNDHLNESIKTEKPTIPALKVSQAEVSSMETKRKSGEKTPERRSAQPIEQSVRSNIPEISVEDRSFPFASSENDETKKLMDEPDAPPKPVADWSSYTAGTTAPNYQDKFIRDKDSNTADRSAPKHSVESKSPKQKEPKSSLGDLGAANTQERKAEFDEPGSSIPRTVSSLNSQKDVGMPYLTTYEDQARHNRMSDECFNVAIQPAVSPPLTTDTTR